MRLLAGIFFSLLIILPAGIRAKQPSVVSCSGVDLYQTATPEQRKQIDSRATTIINGVGRFWKIERQGLHPSWLLGTMHSSDSSITAMTAAEINAFKKSKRLILELKEAGARPQVIDEAIKTIVKEKPYLAFYQPYENPSDQIEPKTFENYQRSLANLGYSPLMVRTVKPWVIWASLSFPKCEIIRQQDGAAILDVKLAIMANESKKPVVGLETVREQLTSLADLPTNIVIDEIINLTKTTNRANNLFYTALNLYRQGNTATLMALSELETTPTDQRANRRAEAILIDKRNQRMFKRALPYFSKGSAFMAVGAAHLPGAHGLIAMLENAGYKVTLVSR